MHLFMPKVWAAGDTPARAVAPELYSAVQKRLFLENTLSASDPAKLSLEDLQSIILQSFTEGQMPSVGIMTKMGASYVATTGLSGRSAGMIPKGRYTIEMAPISNITMQLPASVIISQPINEIFIGMGYSTQKDLINGLINMLKAWFGKIFQPKIPAIPTDSVVPVGVIVELYHDVNNNGKKDADEKLVPWANLKVTLKNTSAN